MKIRTKWMLGVLALLVAASFFREGGSGTTALTLKAEIAASATAVKITNNDTVPWADVAVAVNPTGVGSGGYRNTIGGLVSGQTHTLPLSSFVDHDGARFNPLTMGVVQVRVDATTAAGKRETAMVSK